MKDYCTVLCSWLGEVGRTVGRIAEAEVEPNDLDKHNAAGLPAGVVNGSLYAGERSGCLIHDTYSERPCRYTFSECAVEIL